MLDTDTLQIAPELLALIAEIDEFKDAWHALGVLAPERLRALRRVVTIGSIGSSTRIEGNRLTDREVERLLANLEIKTFATRDEQEVAGYAEVMETIFQAWPDLPVTENHIKQLHRDLLRYSAKDERHRGAYKTLSNSVTAFDESDRQTGIVFETASPFDTPRRMAELIAWLNEARGLGRLHPLLVVAVFVVVFLEIHPFQDGNGRLSRALTTLLLLQAGYAYGAVQLSRKRHREQQGKLLLGLAPNLGHDPRRSTGLAAVVAVFPARFAAAEALPRRQGGTRTMARGRPARAGRPDSRPGQATRPRGHRRRNPRHRREPEHAERAFPALAGAGSSGPAWNGQGDVVYPDLPNASSKAARWSGFRLCPVASNCPTTSRQRGSSSSCLVS